jgi:hypothetical protein
VLVVVVTFIKQALMKLLTIRLRQMRGSKFSRGIDSDRLLFNSNNYCSNGAKQGWFTSNLSLFSVVFSYGILHLRASGFQDFLVYEFISFDRLILYIWKSTIPSPSSCWFLFYKPPMCLRLSRHSACHLVRLRRRENQKMCSMWYQSTRIKGLSLRS